MVGKAEDLPFALGAAVVTEMAGWAPDDPPRSATSSTGVPAMITLREMLSAGYLQLGHSDIDRRPQPQLALGELEALLGWCNVELARHKHHDRHINNAEGAANIADDLISQLQDYRADFRAMCKAIDDYECQMAAE